MTITTWLNKLPIVIGLLLATAALVLFMVAVGGLVVVLSLFASSVTLVALPVLVFTGKRHQAGQILTAWAIYLGAYLAISSGIDLMRRATGHTSVIGEEVCADSGCFAVDKVDKTAGVRGVAYTLSWHLASTDEQFTKHFPGKGLELYMFDERGRKFALPPDANQDPLDVTIAAGERLQQSTTFNIPADVRELFLTARYRPFTFQSFLPGELSLVPHQHAPMIRIQ